MNRHSIIGQIHERRRLALVLFFVSLAVALVAGHTTAVSLFDLLHENLGLGLPLVSLLGGVLFVASYTVLYGQRFNVFTRLSLAAIVVGVIAGHWIGLSFHEGVPLPAWVAIGGGIVVLALCMFVIEHLKHHLRTFRTVSDTVGTDTLLETSRRQVHSLVLLVSTNPFRVFKVDPPSPADEVGAGTQHAGPALRVALMEKSKADPLAMVEAQGTSLMGGASNLGADIKMLDLFARPWYNWQQLLRAIQPFVNHEPLKRVTLIATKDGKNAPGSLRQIPDCVLLLGSYLPQTRVTITHREVDSLEDFDAMVKLYREILSGESKNHGTPPGCVVFDVTGGQKTASIAAAFVTVKDKTLFQYVQTEGDKKSMVYDARMDDVPQIG